jgi:hypothetical protein
MLRGLGSAAGYSNVLHKYQVKDVYILWTYFNSNFKYIDRRETVSFFLEKAYS